MGSTPLRIGVLAQNFAPEPTGNAPYTTRMASGLRERGHQVDVWTTFPHYPEWRIAPGYDGWSVRETVEGVPVRRLRHYVPRHPSTVGRIAAETSFGARLALAGIPSADVLLCPTPALLSTAIALGRYSRARGPAIGLIVQDLYSAGISETKAGGGRSAKALERLESAVLRRADGVVVIHDRFRRRLVDSLHVSEAKIDVIRNWTHIPRVPEFNRLDVRAALGWGDETIVLHAGAMGDKQGLSNVVNAAKLAERRGAPLRFVLLGDGKQRRSLEGQADGCRAIQFIDPLPGDAYVRAMRSADLLLVNQRADVVEMAVPSKLTSYFSTGVAVIAAVDASSVTADEVAASGAGSTVRPDAPEDLVTEALRMREDSRLRQTIGARGPAYCERLLSEEVALDAYDAWVRKLYERKREN